MDTVIFSKIIRLDKKLIILFSEKKYQLRMSAVVGFTCHHYKPNDFGMLPDSTPA